MLLMMCVECGEFVHAVSTENGRRPLEDSCPSCDGTVFKTVSDSETNPDD